MLTDAVVKDAELPVRVEAALAIQMLLSDCDKGAVPFREKSSTSTVFFAAEDILRPHVRPLVLTVLDLIASTEQDDLTNVMDQLIDRYLDEITPVAVEVADKLVGRSARKIED